MGDDVPCADATVGLSGDINPVRIDVELGPHRVEYSKDQKHLRTEHFDTVRNPIRWALGNKYESWISCLVLRLRPRVRAWYLISGYLCPIVRSRAARTVQPQNQRVLFVFVIGRGNKQTVRHPLLRRIRVDTSDETIDHILGCARQCEQEYKSCCEEPHPNEYLATKRHKTHKKLK